MSISFQNIAVIIIFIGAIVFLFKRFFPSSKVKKNDGCGSGNCGC